jgi:hypothetical protein
MGRVLHPDVAPKVENVLKHLNRKHPDTVLFLDTRAAGVSRAINAPPDFRRQLRHLLGNAREAAPNEPLTSLEEEIASREGWARHADEAC